jgi:hypothetical protein
VEWWFNLFEWGGWRMNGLVKVAMCTMLLAGLPGEAQGQVADTVFVGTHHSPWASGLLEMVFPTAGFAYAGDWTRGFLPNAVRVASLVGVGVTAEDDGDTCDDACAVWSVALLGSTIWATIGAVNTAHDYNAAVREPSSLIFEPSPAGGVSLGVRFRR